MPQDQRPSPFVFKVDDDLAIETAPATTKGDYNPRPVVGVPHRCASPQVRERVVLLVTVERIFGVLSRSRPGVAIVLHTIEPDLVEKR